jgi:hypothetical protein
MPMEEGTNPQTEQVIVPNQNEETESFTREYVQQLRAEAKNRRKDNELLQAQLSKFKGIEALLGSEDTPETLKTKMSELQNTNQTLVNKLTHQRIETVATKASAKSNADPELTLAYLQAKGMLDIDVESSTFENDIEKAVAKAVKEKPSLLMQQPTPIGDVPGSPSIAPNKMTEDDFMNQLIRRKTGRN